MRFLRAMLPLLPFATVESETVPLTQASTHRIPGSLSLVLPAYNEEENIRTVVEEALRVQNDWMEIHGLFTSSNLVRGTMKERVAADYSSELYK